MKVVVAVGDKHLGEAITGFMKKRPWPAELELKILHVVEPLAFGVPNYSTEQVLEEDKELGARIVKHVSTPLKEAFPDAKIEELVMIGVPKDLILQIAKAWPADLIVVGSHCCTTLDRYLLGSVAMAVTAHAPCSVALVRVTQGKPLELEMSEIDLPDQIGEFSSV